jgi:hypothetical protein
MKNCYPSSPPVAANSKLDFLDCTFQDNVALHLRGPGGSSRLMGCVFRNNTAKHARTAAFCIRVLDFGSLACVMGHSLANDSLQSSNDTRWGGGAIHASDGYHVTTDRTIENRASDVCGGAIWIAASDWFRVHFELWNDCAFGNNRSPVGADVCASDPQHVDDSSIHCNDLATC